MHRRTQGTTRGWPIALVAALLLAVAGLAGCGSPGTTHFGLTGTPAFSNIVPTGPRSFSATVTVQHTTGVGWVQVASSLELPGFGATGYTSTSTSASGTAVIGFLGGFINIYAQPSVHLISQVQLYDRDPMAAGTASGTVWSITTDTQSTYSYMDVTASDGIPSPVGHMEPSTVAVGTYDW